MKKMKKGITLVERMLAIVIMITTVFTSGTFFAFSTTALAENDCTEHVYSNGFCTNAECDAYQSATDSNADGVYEIGNAGQLYWFAEQVNGGNTSISAILTANITVNTGVLNENGNLNEGTFREWTPIGNATTVFAGNFDGGNHYVSGLYFNKEDISHVGLIGRTSGNVSNVGVKDSYFHAKSYVGGVIGATEAGRKIINCFNESTVNATGSNVGGVAGGTYMNTTFEDCYNTGKVTGVGHVGGIVGATSSTGIYRCWNSGDITANAAGESHVGGIVGGLSYSGSLYNCYNIGSVTGAGKYVGGLAGSKFGMGNIKECYNHGAVNGTDMIGGLSGYVEASVIVVNCYNIGAVGGATDAAKVGALFGITYLDSNSLADKYVNCYYLEGTAEHGFGTLQDETVDCIYKKTSEQFASGEVAYLLNGDQSNIIWYQTCGEGYPAYSGGTVYCNQKINCADDSVEYVYSNNEVVDPKRSHNYEQVESTSAYPTYTCTGCGDTYQETFVAAPEGFPELDGVSFKVDAESLWHIVTEEEKSQYELTESTGTIYVAGNSGQNTFDASNIAIVVTEPGSLTFEYALSAREIGNLFDYFGYRLNEPIDTTIDSTGCGLIAQGKHHPIGDEWQLATINVDEKAFEGRESVTIFIAYVHLYFYESDSHLNYAAIRNIKYGTGARDDVVIFEPGTEEMGTVTSEKQVVTITTNDKGKEETIITYEPANISALEQGNTYRLKAVAKSGYQFYGWIRHYTYNNRNYTAFFPYENDGAVITVDADTYYVPVFALAGTYYIRNGADFYDAGTPIDEVLNNAASGNIVVLVDDYEVPATVTAITVPAGVTFYIPFRDIWGGHEYGTSTTPYHHNGAFGTSISGTDKAYATLTIHSGATMTVKGELILGAERNAPDSYKLQGHISGRFGRINNNGTINMENGSVLTCYGLIDGTGTLLAKDGSAVKESLIVSDFSGGNNSLQLYNQDQMPFKRYSAQNVQCRLQMEAKSKLVAMAVLYALTGHNEVEVNLLGNDSTVVFLTHENRDHAVILERTYNASKQITSGSANCTAGIGKSTWNIFGGLTFQTLTIRLEGVIQLSTARSPFPIPYNMEMNLNSGSYVIDTGLTLLPGSKLVVNSGATLDMSGKLYIYDGLVQSVMSGDKYPTRNDLVKAGFSGTGDFILNGNMYVRSGATLGGVIQSTAPGAVLTIEEGVHLVNSSNNLMTLDPTLKRFNGLDETLYDEWADLTRNDVGTITVVKNWIVQDGGAGHYDDNTTWFNIPARIWNGTELQQLTAGTYLSKTGNSATISDTYVCRYVPEIATGTESGGLTYNTADGNRYMNDGTETFTRTVSGTWTAKSEGVEVTSSTVAGSDKAGTLTAGVTLETVIASNEDGSFTLSLTPKKDGASFTTKMVYLIKCTSADTTVTTAEKTDGGWILPEGTVSITIECAALGDISGDGKINSLDALRAKQKLVGKFTFSELATLSADVSEDGKFNSLDALRMMQHLVGKFSW